MSNIIVIGIPGQWNSRTEIVQSIAGRSDGYLFAGKIIKKLNSDEAFELEIYNHDSNLTNAFRIASQGNFSEELLTQISDHTFTLYVIGESGSLENVQKVTSVTKALLKSGGLAAKIENSGIAHTKTNWIAIDIENTHDLFNAYITYGRDKEFYYSCGMHAFGLPDAIVGLHLNPDEAAELMTVFLHYCLIEKPEFSNGQTFSISTEKPMYRLEKSDCIHFTDESLIHNPFGNWKLNQL